MHGGSRQDAKQLNIKDGDWLAAVQNWKYREYVMFCSGWFKQTWFTEIALDEEIAVVYDRQKRARNAAKRA